MAVQVAKRVGAGALAVVLTWLVAVAAASLVVTKADAAPAAPAKGYALQRVVVVMRHGIRPPTKAQVVPAALSDRSWPQWDVPYGHLTAHGYKAVTVLGAFDAAHYAGLVGTDCSQATGSSVKGRAVRVVADTDERTLKTAEAYVEGAGLKACAGDIEHAGIKADGDGESDPRFSPFETGDLLDPALALKSAQDALPAGGLAGLDAANRARLDAISAIIGCTKADCKLSGMATQLDASKGRVKISGGLDIGSTVGQVLMLEYADGKPLNQVGWGLADKARIRDLLSLHALEFQLVARPKAIADFGAAPLLAEVKRGLFATDTARLTVLVGHDSNLAYIGGALGLHWVGGDFPADDPPPGGAIIFERWQNAQGQQKIVVRFRAQTLDEMRNLTPMGQGDLTTLKPAVCGDKPVCDGKAFTAALDAVIGK